MIHYLRLDLRGGQCAEAELIVAPAGGAVVAATALGPHLRGIGRSVRGGQSSTVDVMIVDPFPYRADQTPAGIRDDSLRLDGAVNPGAMGVRRERDGVTKVVLGDVLTRL